MSYEFRATDEEIIDIVSRIILPPAPPESPEKIARNDIGDHDLSDWVKDLEESAVVDEADL
ncbi:hypothetical protein CMI37_27600 [Candidatus Pacearchaeota archaeon]|nr:hypothetical protein [Candidatus Pacearchaeota archaeon]|tara:strand:+ start:138 stop:320 length:183 start_codon:yes stop_codon:yes gene_type:complete